ncbi:MAG: EAL domain-containing protein [Pseudolabrys sp.]
MIRNDPPADGPNAADILRSIGEAAYEWRLDGDVLSWSPQAAEVFGVPAEQIASGRAFAAHVQAEPGESRADFVQGAAPGEDGVPYVLHYRFKTGDTIAWIEDVGRCFAGPDGKPARAHGIVRRIDERKERERELKRLARFDPLTGELNRAALTEVMAATLDNAVKSRGSCGFLIAAIDHLGTLNESYGVDIADDIIAQVAKRLRVRLRGKDHIGRFSGNKFGIILTSCTPDEKSVAAERLLASVRDEPLVTAAGPVAVTVTIGGVTAPRHARTVPDIFNRAMDALHAARDRRPGSFEAYQPNIERDALRRESLRATDEIVAALNERRIALAFEPVVDAQTRQIAFHECLMRVNRADGGIASAGEIVPVAEKLGLVRMLDYRMMELVIEALVTAPDLRASVNVSPPSTLDPQWSAGLAALLRTNPGTAERLIVEITETAAIQDVDDTRGFVTRMKDLGCRVAIDDFGAGHTSFRNLRRLGADIVKIDGEFVQNIVKSADDRAFVHTLIDLSRRLGHQTVAEWVQCEEAASLLAGWGCDYLQGALIGLASSARPWEAGGKNQAAAG